MDIIVPLCKSLLESFWYNDINKTKSLIPTYHDLNCRDSLYTNAPAKKLTITQPSHTMKK